MNATFMTSNPENPRVPLGINLTKCQFNVPRYGNFDMATRRHLESDSMHILLHFRCFFTHKCIFFHVNKSCHILVQTPHIEKLMSDSCSATPKTPRNVFLRKKFFSKKNFWDTNSAGLPI